MSETFASLKANYTALLANMKITREAQVDATAKKLIGFIDQGRYKAACDITGVPQIVAAASFEREASSNFLLSPAQGDPLDRVSYNVPRGLGPYLGSGAWTRAAIDAYKIDRLDTVGAANWSWERSCFEEELFNGFGPRLHGRNSGYLWSGSNNYTGGKYVSDGVWNSEAVDSQLGVIPIMFRMVEIRPSLTLPIAFPSATTPLMPIQAAPIGLRNAKTLQIELNKLGADPQLVVDDSYGRETRRAVAAFQQAHGLEVDGIAGNATWLEITKQLGSAATKPAPAPAPTPPKPEVNLWQWLNSLFADT